MIRQFMFLFALFISIGLSAQSNFDLLFLTTGDTLRGQVIDFSFKSPVQQIQLERAGKMNTYLLSEVSALKLGDGRYFSTQIQENKLMEIFLEGAIDLYRDTEFYYLKKGSAALLKLYEVKEKVNVNGKMQIRTRQFWKGSVIQSIFDCIKNPADFVRQFSLSERGLFKILKTYHECRDLPYTEYGLKLPWTSFSYGLTAGVVNNKLQTEKLNLPFDFALDEYQDLGIQIGLFIEFGSPRLVPNWSIYSGLLYTSQHFYSDIEGQRGTITQFFELNLRHYILSAPLAIQRQYQLGRTDLNFQVGFQVDYYLSTQARVIREEVFSDRVNTTISEDPIRFKSAYYGYLMGLEVTREIANMRCGIGLRHTGWPQLSNSSDLIIQGNRLSLNAKIYLR